MSAGCVAGHGAVASFLAFMCVNRQGGFGLPCAPIGSAGRSALIAPRRATAAGPRWGFPGSSDLMSVVVEMCRAFSRLMKFSPSNRSKQAIVIRYRSSLILGGWRGPPDSSGPGEEVLPEGLPVGRSGTGAAARRGCGRTGLRAGRPGRRTHPARTVGRFAPARPASIAATPRTGVVGDLLRHLHGDRPADHFPAKLHTGGVDEVVRHLLDVPADVRHVVRFPLLVRGGVQVRKAVPDRAVARPARESGDCFPGSGTRRCGTACQCPRFRAGRRRPSPGSRR